MNAIIDVVIPVFAIVLAGYVVGRAGLLGEGSSSALNRFVYYVALPALFFISMSRLDAVEAQSLGPFLAAWGGSMAILMVVAMVIAAFVFPNPLGALGLHGLSAIFSNTGYMGIPLLVMALGDAGALPGIIATVINGAVVMAVGTVMLELDINRNEGLVRLARNVVVGVVSSPLLIAAVAGLAVAASGIEVPSPIARFCDLVGAAVAPCALFAMGLFMVGRSVTRGAVEVSWITFLKLAVHPLIAWYLAFRAFEMDPVWAQSVLILAALPTGALVFVLAQQYEIYVQRSTAVILISTIVSMATLAALFAWMGVG